MDNLFRYENKFFEILGKVTDMVILNFLFIICSIPIITIGSSTTAAYSIAMKMVNDEEEYITREFFKKFKVDFKISTVIWMLMIIIGGVLIADFYISDKMSNLFIGKILQFIFTLASIVFIFTLTYVFPIISKFDNTVKNTMKNSIFISIQNLPYTIIMVILNLLPLLLMIWFTSFWGYILFFYLVVGFGFTYYINSIFLNRILEKYVN